MYHPEQKFISQGAVAFMAMLGVAGLTLLMPQFFSTNVVEDLQISRLGAVRCIVNCYTFNYPRMYIYLLPPKWMMMMDNPWH